MLNKLLLLLADALAMLCWSRLLLQWARLPFPHPLAQFCVHSTNWLVKPLRKIAPPLGRWDSACVLGLVLVYYLACSATSLLGLPEMHISARMMALNVLLTVLYALKALAYVLFMGLLLRMVLSLSQQNSPLLPALQRLYTPLTRPFAFLRFGRIDFSASVLAVVLWLWLSWWLPALLTQLNLLFLQG